MKEKTIAIKIQAIIIHINQKQGIDVFTPPVVYNSRNNLEQTINYLKRPFNM